jgi:hypothetical protein
VLIGQQKITPTNGVAYIGYDACDVSAIAAAHRPAASVG